MEDPTKKRAHSVPSNYVTLQQLQERRLREQQRQREEEERQRRLEKQREEEGERQRRLEKQREEEERERERQRLKSVQTRRIKSAGRTEKKISGGGVETLAIEGEIEGQEGEVKNWKGKKYRKNRKGKRTADAEKAKREEGSAGSVYGEIVEKLASINVSDRGEMDGVDGLGEKSTAEKRRCSRRAGNQRRVTAVRGEKTGSDDKKGNFRDDKRGGHGWRRGAGRGAERFEGPDGAGGRPPEKPSEQIVAGVNREEQTVICDADEADAKGGGSGTEPGVTTVVFHGSDGVEERSTAESKGASPTKPLVVAAEMPGKLSGLDGVYERSTVKIRSFPRGGERSTAGMRNGFRERRSGGRPANARGQVWVRKEEIPDAARASFQWSSSNSGRFRRPTRGAYTETAGVS